MVPSESPTDCPLYPAENQELKQFLRVVFASEPWNDHRYDGRVHEDTAGCFRNALADLEGDRRPSKGRLEALRPVVERYLELEASASERDQEDAEAAPPSRDQSRVRMLLAIALAGVLGAAGAAAFFRSPRSGSSSGGDAPQDQLPLAPRVEGKSAGGDESPASPERPDESEPAIRVSQIRNSRHQVLLLRILELHGQHRQFEVSSAGRAEFVTWQVSHEEGRIVRERVFTSTMPTIGVAYTIEYPSNRLFRPSPEVYRLLREGKQWDAVELQMVQVLNQLARETVHEASKGR